MTQLWCFAVLELSDGLSNELIGNIDLIYKWIELQVDHRSYSACILRYQNESDTYRWRGKLYMSIGAQVEPGLFVEAAESFATCTRTRALPVRSHIRLVSSIQSADILHFNAKIAISCKIIICRSINEVADRISFCLPVYAALHWVEAFDRQNCVRSICGVKLN